MMQSIIPMGLEESLPWDFFGGRDERHGVIRCPYCFADLRLAWVRLRQGKARCLDCGARHTVEGATLRPTAEEMACAARNSGRVRSGGARGRRRVRA